MANTDNSLRIKSIKVKGLFGLYDHSVTLKEERVTVIHGPNGVGKTVFLKLTDAFLRGSYLEFLSVPLKSFEIHFSDKSLAQITVEQKSHKNQRITLTYSAPNGSKQSKELNRDELNPKRLYEKAAQYLPFLLQLGETEWLDRRTEEIIHHDDLFSLVNEYAPELAKRFPKDDLKEIRELRERINIHFIEAQRLLRVGITSSEWRFKPQHARATTDTVLEYSRDMKRKLESTLATYAKHAQELDQTYPQRVLKGTGQPLGLAELQNEFSDIENTIKRLKDIGVLEDNESSAGAYIPTTASKINELENTYAAVMTVYVKDTKTKLKTLEELSDRIGIFLDILNKKFTNKRVKISRDSGISIIDKDANSIPITSLSSGEQHELVLLYDLLFKVKPNTLVLIDEPELSLHISWQKRFMDDLLEIIGLARFDVVIATHSPFIVNDHENLLLILGSEG